MHGRSIALAALIAALPLLGCEQEYEVLDLAGGDGELRFNLEFTNETDVDLDLHVITPLGEEIYYADEEDSTGGELDVDCLCGSCPQGPSENIFWEYGGNAEPGTYQVSVVYYTSCDFFSGPASEYTLRFLESGQVVETVTGTMANYEPAHEFTHAYGSE